MNKIRKLLLALGITAGVVGGSAVMTGCYAFPHSDRTLDVCVNGLGGWSSAACGELLCQDYVAYNGGICPINIRYATGPR